MNEIYLCKMNYLKFYLTFKDEKINCIKENLINTNPMIKA